MEGRIMKNVNHHPGRFVVVLVALSIAVLAASGAGASDLFGPAITYPVGFEPADVAIGDLNLDGAIDLVVANRGSGTVSILLNDGSGSFEPSTAVQVGSQPVAVAVAAIDNDGLPDIITSNSGSNNVSVLIGVGDGSFADAVHYAVGVSPYGLVVADLDGNGSADVAVVNSESQSFSVLLNTGNGTLVASGTYLSGGAYIRPSWIAAADLDGDDDIDLAVVKIYHNLYFFNGYVDVFTNDGSGAFSATQTLDVGWSATTPILSDLDRDGDPDLGVSGFVDSSYKFSVCLNDGTGSFADPLAYYSAASGRAAAGDLDLDGDTDIVISKEGVGAGSYSVLLNHGNATFADAFTVAVGPGPQGLVLWDLDADGDLDVAVAIADDNVVAVVANLTDPPLLFADDFESADTSAWSTVVP
jgi:hypothetical protein